MITLNGIPFEYANGGLFDSESPWIHPTVTVDTYELILVVSGKVSLREGDREYVLSKGDLLLLEKGAEHGGTAVSDGHTAFYWLHFYADNVEALGFPKQAKPEFYHAERVMKEILHLQTRSKLLCELTLAKFLTELTEPQERKNKFAYEVAEYIRVHARRALTVQSVAERFGYTPDHLARLLKKEFGADTKTLIVRKRLEYLESLLINTDYSVKEIAEQAGFESENAFVKFFKYHEKTTPTLYRHRFFHLHMNIQ